jgi:hypothetical protein
MPIHDRDAGIAALMALRGDGGPIRLTPMPLRQMPLQPAQH